MKNKLKLPFNVGSLWLWHDGGKDENISIDNPWVALVVDIDQETMVVEWINTGGKLKNPMKYFSINNVLLWLEKKECYFV